MADPRKREIKARMKARPGESYMQARRRLTTAADPSTWTVQAVAFLFSCSLPTEPDPNSTFLAAPEMVLAAAVANSAQILTREATGEEYSAWSDVVVLRPQRPARPDEAPPGWYPVEAFIVVRARRPWDEQDEDEEVITDAYRAARDTVTRMWPGLPDEWKPAAMNLVTVAGLRGWTDADIQRLAANPLGRSTTVGADLALLPEET
ncbi:hypothetical protein ACFQ0M_48405 [Kitasatospora aburaviensis]|uniref:Uncharacterized protein n=1 Tax=Kitasatospora aburaviensis TaxID=67265 RepID=A0ABW1EY68_9ACTN